MKIQFSGVLVALVLAYANAWAAPEKMTEQEGSILALLLQHTYNDWSYTVVTRNSDAIGWNDHPATIETCKRDIRSALETNGVGVAGLVDRLFARNNKNVRLSIKSSPKDGYIVDYDGGYEKYFKKRGDGWEKWRKERPNAHYFTTVSIPVYDEKSGFVLVEIITVAGSLAGACEVVLYKYEKGAVKELGRVLLAES
jgi:hypothetical protein